MTLSKQQLETISLVLNDVARCHILGTLERSIYLGVEAELYRLANGPFTLAEAIASGRPFRRKGWGGYVANGVRQIDGAAYFYNATGGESLPDLSDITACDYELAPEVTDATDIDKLRSGVLATEYHYGTWRIPTAEGPSPQAVVTYADSESPETGHVGWCWWALGKMGQSPTYMEARLAAEAALEKDVK